MPGDDSSAIAPIAVLTMYFVGGNAIHHPMPVLCVIRGLVQYFRHGGDMFIVPLRGRDNPRRYSYKDKY